MAQKSANANTTELPKDLKLTGVFPQIAKPIEGTDTCEVHVPCKYSNKKVYVFMYQSESETNQDVRS